MGNSSSSSDSPPNEETMTLAKDIKETAFKRRQLQADGTVIDWSPVIMFESSKLPKVDFLALAYETPIESCILTEMLGHALQEAANPSVVSQTCGTVHASNAWFFLLDQFITKVTNESKNNNNNNKSPSTTTTFNPFTTQIFSGFGFAGNTSESNLRTCTLVEAILIRTKQLLYGLETFDVVGYDESKIKSVNAVVLKTLDVLFKYTADVLTDFQFSEPVFYSTTNTRKNQENRGTFLHFCYSFMPQNLELFKFLLGCGINFDHSVKNAEGYTILHELCLRDNPDTCPFLQEFLSSGQISDHKWMLNKTYESPPSTVAILPGDSEDEKEKKQAFQKNLHIISTGDRKLSPVALAAGRGAVGIVNDLVSTGVGGCFESVDMKNYPESSPLFFCLSCCSPSHTTEEEKFLTEEGPQTSLSQEEEKKRVKIIHALLSLPRGVEAICWCVDPLVTAKMDNPRERKILSSCLSHALEHGYCEILKVFLSNVKLTKEEKEELGEMKIEDGGLISKLQEALKILREA